MAPQTSDGVDPEGGTVLKHSEGPIESTVAYFEGRTTAVFLMAHVSGFGLTGLAQLKHAISESTRVSKERVFLLATHNHCAPSLEPSFRRPWKEDDPEPEEIDNFIRRAESGDEDTLLRAGLNFPRALSPAYRGLLVKAVRPRTVSARGGHGLRLRGVQRRLSGHALLAAFPSVKRPAARVAGPELELAPRFESLYRVSMATIRFETRVLSSLTKVFADEALAQSPVVSGSALANEVYSFQVAYYSDRLLKGLTVRVDSDLSRWLSVRAVGLVPCELPWRDEHDEDVLRTTPGLYPDPLYPVANAAGAAAGNTAGGNTAGGSASRPVDFSVDPGAPVGMTAGVVALPEQWRSLWVTVDPSRAEGLPPAGAHLIRLSFELEGGEGLGSAEHELEIIDAELPPQELICTEWFHTDCLSTHYGVPVFSEEHWLRIEQYVDSAVRHGVTMILTPIFTPPLDTAVGAERPTVQLVDVIVRTTAAGTEYEFGFQRLERWITLCDRLGVQYFEFSHLFTQWGAEFCPKVVATVDGEEQRIFGWDTPAAGEAYREFLSGFLPALVSFIRDRGIAERSYFHVSDEPRLEQLDQYRTVREMITDYLSDFPIMDALSNYEFYERGVVDLPVPASNHIEPFIEHGVEPLWTYYCVGQRIGVSNRFFSMPSARNRVLGIQLYKFNVAGFLQWGFNFWYSQYSVRPVDPFKNTDAGYAFPSGDAFLVYPGPDGPVDSLRYEVFREALQDLRALRLLESLIGREETLAIVEADVAEPITFDRYPRSADWLLETRRRVNQAIRTARTG